MVNFRSKTKNLSQEDLFNFSELFKLMKPRVMSLVIFTCAVGLLTAPNVIPNKDAIIGILLVSLGAGAAGALNMWYESDLDALMTRTCLRPIPAGKVNKNQALILGVTLSIVSVITLDYFANRISAAAQVKENQEIEATEPTAEELLQTEKDKYLRLFAEFENYKKRTTRERIELFKTAGQELMTSLLPVMDDFDRGLAEIKKAKDKELLKGMQLINDKLRKTLEQKGLTLMNVKAGDVFNADIHEAITQIPAPSDKLKGKVIDCVESGYTLGDKIIRFPKVVIGQ